MAGTITNTGDFGTALREAMAERMKMEWDKAYNDHASELEKHRACFGSKAEDSWARAKETYRDSDADVYGYKPYGTTIKVPINEHDDLMGTRYQGALDCINSIMYHLNYMEIQLGRHLIVEEIVACIEAVKMELIKELE
jgi:hypothetical protein